MANRTTPSDVTRLRMQVMGLARRLRRETRSGDQTWARLLILGAIGRHAGTATPSLLASHEGMRSSNIAATLRELESSGLIVRTPDRVDKRKVRVRLTAAGRKLLDDNRAQRERWLAQAMQACLTKQERARLCEAGDLLERIAAYATS